MFFKLNNGEVIIKGRRCADGRKRQNWMYKEDTTLTTFSSERLMMPWMIDAMEGHYVATADIPGVFLKMTKTKEIYI